MNAAPTASAPGGHLARRVATAAAVLLVGGALGVGAGLAVSPGEPAAVTATGSAPVDEARTAVVLGGGTVAIGQDALDLLDARGTARVLPGAGYGSGAPPLGQAVLRYLPDPDLDLLAVQGGELDVDSSVPASTIELGAVHLIDRVRAGAGPRTAIVLVGPVPSSDTPGPRFLEVRDAVRAAAVSRGVPFLDPQVLGWTTDSPSLSRDLATALVPLFPAA